MTTMTTMTTSMTKTELFHRLKEILATHLPLPPNSPDIEKAALFVVFELWERELAEQEALYIQKMSSLNEILRCVPKHAMREVEKRAVDFTTAYNEAVHRNPGVEVIMPRQNEDQTEEQTKKGS